MYSAIEGLISNTAWAPFFQELILESLSVGFDLYFQVIIYFFQISKEDNTDGFYLLQN